MWFETELLLASSCLCSCISFSWISRQLEQATYDFRNCDWQFYFLFQEYLHWSSDLNLNRWNLVCISYSLFDLKSCMHYWAPFCNLGVTSPRTLYWSSWDLQAFIDEGSCPQVEAAALRSSNACHYSDSPSFLGELSSQTLMSDRMQGWTLLAYFWCSIWPS